MDKAEADLMKSWEIRCQIVGVRSSSVALNSEKLAELYLSLRRDKLADKFSSEALSIGREWYRVQPKEALFNLTRFVSLRGRFYAETNQLEAAQELMEEELKLIDEAGQSESTNAAEVWGRLAAVAQSQGNVAYAEELYDKALPLLRRRFGPQSPKIAGHTLNLSEIYNRKGNHEQAEVLCREAVEIQEKAYGSEHPLIVTATGNLAAILMNLGKIEEAEMYFTRALKLASRVLPPAHPQTVKSMRNYAVLLHNKDEHQKAALFESEAARLEVAHQTSIGLEEFDDKKELLRLEAQIDQQTATLGAKHPATLMSRTQKARGLQRQSRLTESKAEFESVWPLWEEVSGPRSHNVAAVLGDLCALCVAVGEVEKALVHGQNSLLIREELQETSDTYFADFLSNYAFALETASQVELAEQMHEKSVRILQTLKGNDFPGVVPRLRRLAGLQMNRAGLVASEDTLLEIVQIQEKRWGKEHLGVTGDLESIAIYYELTGREESSQQIRERIAKIEELFVHNEAVYSQVERGWQDENIPLKGQLVPPSLLILAMT